MSNVRKSPFLTTTRHESKSNNNVVVVVARVAKTNNLLATARETSARMMGAVSAMAGAMDETLRQANILSVRSTLVPHFEVSHLSTLAVAPTTVFIEKSEVSGCEAMILAQ